MSYSSKFYVPKRDGETLYRALIVATTTLQDGSIETNEEAYGPYKTKAPATTKINQSKRTYDQIVQSRKRQVDFIRARIGTDSFYTQARLQEAIDSVVKAEHTTYTYEVQTSEPDWKNL